MADTVPRTKTLKNGAVYDLDKKRIVSGAVLSSASASEMSQLRLTRKRERIAAGANAIAAEGGRYDGTDLDFVEALAEAMAQKALNVDDPKAVDAARFLLQESGLSERAGIEAQTQRQRAQPDVLLALLAVVGASDNIIDISTNDAIDGETIDADGGGQGGGG